MTDDRRERVMRGALTKVRHAITTHDEKHRRCEDTLGEVRSVVTDAQVGDTLADSARAAQREQSGRWPRPRMRGTTVDQIRRELTRKPADEAED